MKQKKYIYKVVQKYNNPEAPLEFVLNNQNTDKLLIDIVELEYEYILVYEE